MERELTEQHLTAEFVIDLENIEYLDKMPERSMLFYANPDFALDLALVCLVVTILLYGLARIQGRIRTRIHSGIHLFWTCLVFGDLAVVFCGVAFTAYTYFLNQGWMDTVTCIDVSPLNKYYAFAWLMLWGLFVVAVLRSTVAITWLNRIRNTDRLADMGRGVGILCLSLIYLFPLALISRTNADSLPENSAPLTVCLPAFSRAPGSNTIISTICIAWLAAILLATIVSGRMSETRRCSRLAVPLAIVTHFIPSTALFVWVTSALNDVTYLSAMLPAVYALLTAFNAICNFFTYKLFPLASEDAEVPQCGNGVCQSHGGMTEQNHVVCGEKARDIEYASEAPPAYCEKVTLV